MGIRWLRPHKVAELEAAWRDGERVGRASVIVGCSHDTAARYYKRFKAASVPRGELKPRRKRGMPRWMIYTGPEWIGAPAQ